MTQLQQQSLEEQVEIHRKACSALHDQMKPLEVELARLSADYMTHYKSWQAADYKLAKLDGRYKKCRPYTSGKKTISHGDPTRVLTKEQLEFLIKKLETEIKDKKN